MPRKYSQDRFGRGGMSRRNFLKIGAAATSASAFAVTGFPAIGQTKPAQLLIADPGGVTRESYVKAQYETFTAATGIRIVPVQYMGAAQLKAMVDAKAWGNADIVMTAAGDGALAAQRGLTEKIDYDLFDRKKILPQVANDHYIWSDVAASLLAWNTTKYNRQTAPQNWVDFFTPGKFKGPRGLWKNAAGTMDLAALGAGIPKEKLYPLDIDKAIGSLRSVKSELVFWEHGAESVQFLIDNRVDFEFAWNGRVHGPKMDKQPVDYTFTDAVCNGDCIVIPKGSPNAYWSQRLVAHLMDPKNQAAFAALIPYGPTNIDANALIPADVQARLPTGPENLPKVVFQDVNWWAENGQKAFDAFNAFLLS